MPCITIKQRLRGLFSENFRLLSNDDVIEVTVTSWGPLLPLNKGCVAYLALIEVMMTSLK